jgi:hypothetical protein
VKAFYNCFRNDAGQVVNLERVRDLLVPEASIIRVTGTEYQYMNIDSFVGPRQQILTDGSLTGFSEFEVKESTIIKNNIAQRRSLYLKEGVLEGKHFMQKGNKFFQFVRRGFQWKICSIVWEDLPFANDKVTYPQ